MVGPLTGYRRIAYPSPPCDRPCGDLNCPLPTCFSNGPRVVNVGLPRFADDLRAAGVPVTDVAWTPPASADAPGARCPRPPHRSGPGADRAGRGGQCGRDGADARRGPRARRRAPRRRGRARARGSNDPACRPPDRVGADVRPHARRRHRGDRARRLGADPGGRGRSGRIGRDPVRAEPPLRHRRPDDRADHAHDAGDGGGETGRSAIAPSAP